MPDYEIYLDDLNKLLLSKSVSSAFTDDERKLLKSVVGLINFHIYKMSSEEDIVDNYDNKIKDAVLILVDKILKSSINKDLVFFCRIFSETIYNWNNNHKNDILLSKLCLLLNKFLALYDASVNVFNKSRSILSLFFELNAWTPPSFELDKELLQELIGG